MPKERVLIDPAKITAISDVVRQKLNETTQYTLDELPDAIRRITKSGPHYTPEQIREFASHPFVIASLYKYSNYSPEDAWKNQYATKSWRSYNGNTNNRVETSVTLNNYVNDGNRKVGLINGTHSDGSLNVTLLGHGKILRYTASNAKYCATSICAVVAMGGSNAGGDNRILDKNTIIATQWTNTFGGMNDKYVKLSAQSNNNIGSTNGMYYTTNYVPTWQNRGGRGSDWDSERFLRLFSYLNGQKLEGTPYYNEDIQLTTNPNTSLTIGSLSEQYDYTDKTTIFFENKYSNIGGNLYDLADDLATKMVDYLDGMMIDKSDYSGSMLPKETGTYACHYTPYNLILTHNESEALRYIEDGTLPSDVIIYPFDVSDIMSNFN